jgi:hypothetical protein
MVGASWKDIRNHGVFPLCSNILRTVQGAEEAVVTAFKWLVGSPGPKGCGAPGFADGQSLRLMTKIDPSQMEGREPPSTV